MITNMPALTSFIIIFICAALGIILASLDALWMSYKSNRKDRK